MKLTKYFMPVAAVALLASCSNENVDQPNVNTPQGPATAYALIKINMPGVGTRAEESSDFANGSTTESVIKDVKLALYDSHYNYVGYGELIDEIAVVPGTGTVETADPTTGGKYSQEFKLNLTGGEDPEWVVAFINTDVNTTDFDQLAAQKIGQYEDNGFIMTNSGYYDEDGVWTVAAEFDYSKAYTEAEKSNAQNDAPIQNAATIYVERLASKVTLKKANTITKELNYEVKDVLGSDINLEFTPKKWGITGKAQEEYVIKNAFDASTYDWAVSTSYPRSYFAEGVNWGLGIDKYTTANKDSDPLLYLTFGDLANQEKTGDSEVTGLKTLEVNTEGTSDYTLEHTVNTNPTDDEPGVAFNTGNLKAFTYAIVTGNYAVDGDNGDWFGTGNLDFYLLADGTDNVNNKQQYRIFTEDQLIGYLLSYNGIAEVSTEDHSQTYKTGYKTEGYGETDATFDYSTYFTLGFDYSTKKYKIVAKEGAEPLYKETETGWVAIDAAGLDKQSNSRNYRFPDGGAYFNVAIYTDDEGKVSGVVRNHSYVLTINKIKNLGAPLDDNLFITDPDDPNPDPDPTPVVPDPDDYVDHFIQAEINVLQWHVVENGVEL